MNMHAGRLLAVSLMALRIFPATPKPVKPKDPPLTAEQRAVQAQLKTMSLRDKVAQLVIVTANGDVYSHTSPEFEKYRHWVADLHVGGIIINNASQYGLVRNAEPHVLALFLNQMQKLAKTPLLVASDFERAASMRVTGGTPAERRRMLRAASIRPRQRSGRTGPSLSFAARSRLTWRTRAQEADAPLRCSF